MFYWYMPQRSDFLMKLSMSEYWPYVSFVVLLALVGITKNSDVQFIILLFPLMLLPFIDRNWVFKKSIFQTNRRSLSVLISLIILVALPVALNIITVATVVSILLYSALPEEWFFRAYLLNRLGNDTKANIISSLLFCSLHAFAGDFIHAALVFIPSVALGYVFIKYGNFGIVVFLHLLFNIVYTVSGLKDLV